MPAVSSPPASAPPSFWRQLWGVPGVLLLIAVVGCAHLLTFMGIELYRIQQSHQRMASIREDIRHLETELIDLQSIVAHSNDARYREQLARQQGFTFPDDVLIRTVDSEGKPVVLGTRQ